MLLDLIFCDNHIDNKQLLILNLVNKKHWVINANRRIT